MGVSRHRPDGICFLGCYYVRANRAKPNKSHVVGTSIRRSTDWNFLDVVCSVPVRKATVVVCLARFDPVLFRWVLL